MSSFELKSVKKTEPLGLWSVQTCNKDQACVDVGNLYRVEGEFSGFLRDKKYSYIGQRQASDPNFMKKYILDGKSCLNIDPCDQYVKPLCCDTKLQNNPTSQTTQTTTEENKPDNKTWIVLMTVLIVFLVIAVISLAGIAFYVAS